MKKIIHVCIFEKFLPPFVKFLSEEEHSHEHKYYFTGNFKDADKYKIQNDNVCIANRAPIFLRMIYDLHAADKIILHGLISMNLYLILISMPWLLKKSYWVIWGSDLYESHASQNKMRAFFKGIAKKFIIKRLGHFITYIKGDYDLAKKWYGAKGEYHECIMYLSNVFEDQNFPLKKNNETTLLIGNSGFPSNNHYQAFDKLSTYKDYDLKIYIPLSYGDGSYIENIKNKGSKNFGKKFIPLTEFLPLAEYKKILSEVDIGVFANKNQQAMGTIIALLGMGKKVYMRNDITPWSFFQEKGIKVFDIEHLDMKPLSENIANTNIERVKDYFSKKQLIKQLNTIFDS
ncbi:MAG: hypothetical protein DHS20C02_20060 [Micavibrio sp.]|nr:MAG: hypothetical protein DHS20C02_20060 [Micavibrio sp.]